MYNYLNDLKLLIPEIFLLAFLLYILIFGVYYSNVSLYKFPQTQKSVWFLSNLGLIWTFLLTLNSSYIPEYLISNNSLFYNTSLAIFFKLLLIGSALILFLISYNYLRISKSINVYELYVLKLIAVFSMLLLITSYNFISLYLTIELQSLCFYVLAALNRNSLLSIEASIKYFVLGGFSSALLLFSIVLFYSIYGTFSFQELNFILKFYLLDDSQLQIIFTLGMISFLIGFFFKLGLAPFHLWLPDVYLGIAKFIVVFFALLPKIPLLFVFWRLHNTTFLNNYVYELNFSYIDLVLGVILLTWFIGSLGAITQDKLWGLFAFSGIVHTGFLTLCVLMKTIEIFCLYSILYIILSVIISILLLNLSSFRQNENSPLIKELSFFNKINFTLAMILSLTFLSLAGIPPLSGFFFKFYLFLELSLLGLYKYTLISFFLSGLSSIYYLRITYTFTFINNKNYIFYKNRYLTFFNAYLVSLFFILNIIFLIFFGSFVDIFSYIS